MNGPENAGSKPNYPSRHSLFLCLPIVALVIAGFGCSSPHMKGTPFYTGESKGKGPAEQRINLWPAFYYRDPALSVAWPIFEMTDDHTAVRPLFSVYGLDKSNRQYNVLWPMAKFDYRTGRNRVFPVFWGSNYYSVFPLYRHSGDPWGEKGGKDALLPLWSLNRNTNYFDLYSPWPLVHQWSNKKRQESGSMVFPLYWHETNTTISRFYSLPWWSRTETNGNYWRLLAPLYYQASNDTFSALATPFYAQGRSASKDWQAVIPLVYWDSRQRTLISPFWAVWQSDGYKRAVAPWAASWWAQSPEHTDLWLAAGLAHANWGKNPGPHHVFPLYYRDAPNDNFLTPLFGWNKEESGFFYPVTPLVGVYTGQESGSWAFPIYSYARDKQNGELSERFLLLGGYNEARGRSHSWFIPLFTFRDNGPLDSAPTEGEGRETYGKKFWCLPFCWYENQCHVSPGKTSMTNPPKAAVTATNTAMVREFSYKNGAFPLWSYNRKSMPGQKKSVVKASTGVIMYDYKHETSPWLGGKPGATNDYTRARVLWRLYHYERRNNDISVDLFPTVTYDSKVDGSKKFSFLWRFCRYERAANGAKKLDLLFVPVMRSKS